MRRCLKKQINGKYFHIKKGLRLCSAAPFLLMIHVKVSDYQAKASSVISRGDFSPILMASERAFTVVRISLVKNFAEAILPL
jgi:hypothetical protein